MVGEQLDKILSVNPGRLDYYNRYQQIINDYNAGQDKAIIEQTFMELMRLAQELTVEEARYVREGFSTDEELSMYDLLWKDNLSKNDIKKLKMVASLLVQKIKERISQMDHWTDKEETTAEVKNLIRDVLWTELPEYCDEEYIATHRDCIYEYIYSRYSMGVRM